MFQTWNHLAWRRAARASRHFCLSKTSAGSFTILEVTSKNGSNCQMVVRNGCLTRSEKLPRTHCHTYQSVPDHCSFKKHLTFHPICRIFQIFSTTLRISYTCHLVHFYLVCGAERNGIGMELKNKRPLTKIIQNK